MKTCFISHLSRFSKSRKTSLKITALCGLLTVLFSPNAIAEGKLTVYCSVQNVTCEKVTQHFAEKYNVETQFVRNSTGTILGKIKSEKSNPQADVWYGGTLEPHLQAADQGLLESYRSPLQKDIMPRFNQLMQQRGDFISIIYLMELGIGVNTEKLAKLGIPEPKCFKDLLDPAFKDQIQYADPRVSGTGYSFLTTLIELFGEQQAFDYLKKLHNNVAQYSKSGLATGNLATGEVAVDISFMHSYVREQEKGSPVKGILPCEGIGYTLGATSIIKGARNLDNAKLFIDYLLSPEAQEIPWREADSYQLPTNIHAQPAPKASDPTKLKFIDIDFIRFGSNEESKRLLEKWFEATKADN
ncbi:ABC transporter substrate-binding protein [Lonepinella sp. MS14437]|uniref:ABC transporter substrate-binding protein n=1 Tax=Lonepinella sp. MS14437 TaxID=3003620 RepID=UPI0036DB8C8B